MGKRASLGRMSMTGVSSDSSPQGNSGSLQGGGSSASSIASQIGGQAESLAQDMANLMHDFDAVSRIANLIGSMRAPYEGLTTELTSAILADIQGSIRQKDEEMAFMDACCLQIAVKSGRGSKDKPETYTYQTRDPNVKKEWVVGKFSQSPLPCIVLKAHF